MRIRSGGNPSSIHGVALRRIGGNDACRAVFDSIHGLAVEAARGSPIPGFGIFHAHLPPAVLMKNNFEQVGITLIDFTGSLIIAGVETALQRHFGGAFQRRSRENDPGERAQDSASGQVISQKHICLTVVPD